MEPYGIIMTVFIGSLSGWFAGLILKGKGKGFWLNTLIGIIGAFVGNYFFQLIDFSIGTGLIGTVFTSTTGAVILLFIVNLLKKA
ncbi:MAG: GlsB/YeaQ/YmgE family stress response membrane protein [Gammaproteobacteria bacterium]|nr:GlsB/YeaQ/YmgE family stress response membrane protein [Gammaproteobacteria bacterium]